LAQNKTRRIFHFYVETVVHGGVAMDLKINRIKQIRRKQDITQDKLGEITEIDQSDISKIERGVIQGLTLINAAKIAKALGHSIEYIWPHLLD